MARVTSQGDHTGLRQRRRLGVLIHDGLADAEKRVSAFSSQIFAELDWRLRRFCRLLCGRLLTASQ
jgi:hypothetical protein